MFLEPYGEPGVKPRKWVFRSSMQDNFQVETILGYAKGKGWDAIGLMHDTSGYGTASKATADTPPTPWAQGARRFADRVVCTPNGWRIGARRVVDNHVAGSRLDSYVTGWRYPALANA